MQNLGGQTKSIIVVSEVACGSCRLQVMNSSGDLILYRFPLLTSNPRFTNSVKIQTDSRRLNGLFEMGTHEL